MKTKIIPAIFINVIQPEERKGMNDTALTPWMPTLGGLGLVGTKKKGGSRLTPLDPVRCSGTSLGGD